jgi:hypothetical protein
MGLDIYEKIYKKMKNKKGKRIMIEETKIFVKRIETVQE